MTMLLRIAERALNRPLMVHPDKLPLVLGVLEGRIPLGDIRDLRDVAAARIAELPEEAQAVMNGPERHASRFVGSNVDVDPGTGAKNVLPYRRTSDGVAIIPVIGSLINRGAWVGSYSGETSYEGLKFQIGAAANDPRTTAILLDIESPGGEAVGAFEAADAVRAANAKKPVVAVVNGMAASAAYAIASAAGTIVTGSTGVVGSIGVVMLHADFSRQIDKAGITPTFIFAGAHKVDGNPLEPLPEQVKSDLQREVDQFYELFVQSVAKGRRPLSAKSIRDTEARVFIGEEAVKAGLADAVGTFESALADLSASTARARAPFNRSANMSNTNGQAAADQGSNITLETHTAAVEKAKADGHTAGKAEGVAEGRKAERERLATILGSEKIKGREATALKLATESPDMTAEKVIAFVAALPAGASTIEQRMNGQGADLSLGAPMTQPNASGSWDKVVANTNKSRGLGG